MFQDVKLHRMIEKHQPTAKRHRFFIIFVQYLFVGGLVYVLRAMPVGAVWTSGDVHTTGVFEQFLDAIADAKMPSQRRRCLKGVRHSTRRTPLRPTQLA